MVKVTRLGAGEPVMAVFEYGDEAHAIPVFTDHRGHVFATAHGEKDGRYSKDCLCKPVVNWHSSFAPLPLYEHDAAWTMPDA